MARLQEQALHAGIEATTSLQFGMPGQLFHCPPFWQNTGWNPCELKASPRCTCFAHAGIWCRLLCGAERQTKCLVSVKKDTFASASNTHCFLTLSSGLLYVRRALPCMHACTAAPRKKNLHCKKEFPTCKKQFLNCINEGPNCRRAGPSSDAGPLQKASGGAGPRAEPGCPSAPPVRCPAELHAVQPWTPPCSGLTPHTHSSAQSRYHSCYSLYCYCYCYCHCYCYCYYYYYHLFIIYYCSVLIGLLYKAEPDGCQHRFTNFAEAMAQALPYDKASPFVKAGTILTLTVHVRFSFTQLL